MNLDHYVTLGRSGLRVSPFCLGCMTFGDEWKAVGTHEAESLDVLAAYLDAGGNFLAFAWPSTPSTAGEARWPAECLQGPVLHLREALLQELLGLSMRHRWV